MMRRRLLLGSVAVLAISVAPLGAQDRPAACAPGTFTSDACEKATDLFNYMMPQLGTALVGGSHTLGVGGTLGGFPHFALGLRLNAVAGDLPDIGAITISGAGAQRSDLATNSQVIGLPGLDMAVGIFKGFPVGVSRMGGVDLLGSFTFVPDVEDADAGVSITPTDGSIKFGLGARVGILEQSLVVPGVSFSYLKRDLPTLDLTATAQNADFDVSDFNVKTTSWRLAAQKNLMLFQLSAGVGQDTYESSADITSSITSPVVASSTTSHDQSLTRTTMYGSLGFNLFLAKVVGEVGRVSGGDVPTYNSFSEEADKARLYGSIGIRVSF